MAVGDVVNDIQTIAAAARLTFQPAAGVEIMITGFSSTAYVNALPNAVPFVLADLFDGAINCDLDSVNADAAFYVTRRIFITNSIYLRLQNSNGIVENLSYWGIQTK